MTFSQYGLRITAPPRPFANEVRRLSFTRGLQRRDTHFFKGCSHVERHALANFLAEQDIGQEKRVAPRVLQNLKRHS
jgi:hypothetical protein